MAPEVEERAVYNALRGMVRGGVPELAFGYLDEQIAAYPDRKFYYQAQFSLYQALGARAEAAGVVEAWERQSGERDPEMVQALERMGQDAMRREQQRIDDALKGQPDGN